MEPKVGDKVKVTVCLYMHLLSIGEVVTIKEDHTEKDNDYLIVSEKYPEGFRLTTEEFEEI